ncbi:MAG: lycopene cyclase family protein [Ginsengibacter sp.]
MQASQYDYIFLGAGCATLSIVLRMIESNNFATKKILIIDKEKKNKNDRTWCFWEKEADFFEKIVYKTWSNLSFKTDNTSIALDIQPYQYKMIRGIDFYNYCFDHISYSENVDVVFGKITFENENGINSIRLNNEELNFSKNTFIFNSIYKPGSKQKGKYYLLQHFKGWIIETEKDCFDPGSGTLMDFRVSQQHGTTFVYVLPLSSKTALVEYTLFTDAFLSQEEYDNGLKDYLKNYTDLEEYKVTDEEFGVIPMTNAVFPSFTNGMYFIGTAGGQTKASTGYTFKFIQKQSAQIVKELSYGKLPLKKLKQDRFYFYDSTLLNILVNRTLAGKDIFSTLFRKNKAALVFKFLDNETNIPEDFKIINSLPKKEFLKAGLRELSKMIAS